MTPSPNHHPDLEEIAAFAEGSLDPDERIAIEEHLAACDRCLELASETVHCLEESSWSSWPLPSDRTHMVPRSLAFGGATAAWFAAAAVVVAMVTGLLVIRRWSYDLDRTLAQYEPGLGLDAAFGEGWSTPGWTRLRTGTPATLAGARAGFRAGVHSVDIAVAVTLRDASAARAAVVRTVNLEPENDPSLLPLQELADQVARALEPENPVWSTAQERSQELLQAQLRGDLDLYRQLGQWAQSARFASLAHDDRYFRSRAWRTGLGRLPAARLGEEATNLRALQPGQHAERLKLLDDVFQKLGG